ncbi:hypothetical protein MRX96_026802 [Rhipicephalus microplus]
MSLDYPPTALRRQLRDAAADCHRRGQRQPYETTKQRMGLCSQDTARIARNHTKLASGERKKARKPSQTLLYDRSQLRADCWLCHAVTRESTYDRVAASTYKPATRTGFSPHYPWRLS